MAHIYISYAYTHKHNGTLRHPADSESSIGGFPKHTSSSPANPVPKPPPGFLLSLPASVMIFKRACTCPNSLAAR